MNLKNVGDSELQEELTKAKKQLSEVESNYVRSQNICEVLEQELNRRQELSIRGVQKIDINDLVAKWSNKANDIQRAADVFMNDPASRHSLLMQVDLITSCISDLKRVLGGGSLTDSIRT